MTKNKKIIIGLVGLIVIIGFAYVQFGNPGFEDDSSLLTDSGSALSIDATGSAEVIQSEAFFLQQIEQLRQVSIENTEVIEGEGFKALSDNTVILNEFKAGRTNPYQPIDARVTLRERVEAEARAATAAETQSQEPVFNLPNNFLPQSQGDSSESLEVEGDTPAQP